MDAKLICIAVLAPTTLCLLIIRAQASGINFTFPKLDSNTVGIKYMGNASQNNIGIHLTGDSFAQDSAGVGRALYDAPIPLWQKSSGDLITFTTAFRFTMQTADDPKMLNSSDGQYGDGFAFLMAPVGAEPPVNSSGAYLGLFNTTTNGDPSNHIVAVEFDTARNFWDPVSIQHLGIDVHNISSVATATFDKIVFGPGRTCDSSIHYDGLMQKLQVFLSCWNTTDSASNTEKPTAGSQPLLSYEIDLSKFLPENIEIGFSSGMGDSLALPYLTSWNFTSESSSDEGRSPRTRIIVIASACVASLCISLFFGSLRYKKVKALQRKDEGSEDIVLEMDERLAQGPRKFTYSELSTATGNFSPGEKLGQGGFGGVYRGILPHTNEPVAVKRISEGSKQGKKEYVAEVTIISRLRHRNLVQLLGWCHEKGELLLVYEYMPNGSLDTHIFGSGARKQLNWSQRYKIACGIASALLYLHEEWDQCVVHRDVKSSNVMLDSNFNAKLGDFGLARLVEHDGVSRTTVVAGTLGYLAPECVITGKASAESDVFSFGAVALEIACGRRAVDTKLEDYNMRLVEWAWDHYGEGRLLECSGQICKGCNAEEVERLMVVGLWCSHPDSKARPTMRQVLKLLKFEAPLPHLPPKLPVATYSPVVHPDDLLWSVAQESTGSAISLSSNNRAASTSTTSSSADSSRHISKPLLCGQE